MNEIMKERFDILLAFKAGITSKIQAHLIKEIEKAKVTLRDDSKTWSGGEEKGRVSDSEMQREAQKNSRLEGECHSWETHERCSCEADSNTEEEVNNPGHCIRAQQGSRLSYAAQRGE
jgi:hypothetical protein